MSLGAGFIEECPGSWEKSLMPRPKKTPKEIAEMRDRIVTAAMDLLEEAGMVGLSIRKIGKRLGVSHMVLYTYFESRNAVVEALKARWMEKLQARREQTVQAARAGDALAVLRKALGEVAQLAHEHPRLYDLAWVYTSSDEFAHDRSTYTEGYLDYLARLIALCIERGQCVARNPRRAAAMALCIVNSPHVLYRSERLADEALYGQLEPEALQAAMSYLTHHTAQGPDL
jgi:AcrR family transcriptional regulator